MVILLNILGIEINLQVFIAFFIGLFLGFILLLLIYLYAVLKGLKRDLILNKVEEEDIDEEEIKWLILSAQKNFKNKELRQEVGYGGLLSSEIKELTMAIASKFYPNSPYPYLELTIDETLEFTNYLTNRVKELMASPILKMFRAMTLRKIAELNNTKNKIEESRLVKVAKKTKITKIASSALKVLNLANPFYWFKKLTIDQAVSLITVRIGTEIIAIVGEETYKVYSKKVFQVEKTLEPTVEDLYESIKEELKEVEEDEWKTS